ncbi:TonB-dependent receptor [Comamonas sp. Y33R10-2]|uniref:TonB-dependent receptor domain-containing protein n=1 Tax=Comamonas sp. Y33R10-2 TaxID=2853257 RepID=UPI001C5C93DC|nr:TonB-dependent receptor [Comamonas sp. Y33R10-2]QXZ10300.1 TonB-dependent receptor [Comamonas sp. Y33R10-2]
MKISSRHAALSTPLHALALASLFTCAGASAETQMETVVVTANGAQQAIKDAPASISVITQEDLKKGNYQSVADAVTQVEGVSVVGDTANTADISIRGLPGDYTLILVDGMRQNTRETMNRGTGGVQSYQLPPLSAIERIEVVRGPMSSLYGSEAMGGVINIITKKAPTKWSGSVSTSATLQSDKDFGNSRQSEFWLGGPVHGEMLGLQVSGMLRDRNEAGNYYSTVNGANGQEQHRLGAKLTLRPSSRQEVVLDLGTERLETEVTSGRSTQPGARVPLLTQTMYARTNYGLSHTGRWSFGNTKVALYNEDSKHESASAPTRKVSNTTLDANLTMPFDKHVVRMGGQMLRSELKGLNNETGVITGHPTNPNTISLSNYALFLEDDWLVTDKLTLTGGMRFDKDERSGSHLSPRLYAVYQASSALTLRGGVTTGFKAPTIRQSSAEYCMSSGGPTNIPGSLCGNPALKPETSVTQEFGMSYEWAPAHILTATLYNTNFRNKVVSFDTGVKDPLDRTGANNIYVYDNVDSVKIRGLELGLKMPLTRSLSLNANYTYTQSKRQGGSETAYNGNSLDGQPLERTPKHMLHAKLDWQASDALQAFARLNFNGQARYAGYRNYAMDTRTRGSSVTLDFGGNYAINKQVSLRFALLNVTDRKVAVDERGRSTLTGNWIVDEGRRLWLGMNAQF